MLQHVRCRLWTFFLVAEFDQGLVSSNFIRVERKLRINDSYIYILYIILNIFSFVYYKWFVLFKFLFSPTWCTSLNYLCIFYKCILYIMLLDLYFYSTYIISICIVFIKCFFIVTVLEPSRAFAHSKYKVNKSINMSLCTIIWFLTYFFFKLQIRFFFLSNMHIFLD